MSLFLVFDAKKSSRPETCCEIGFATTFYFQDKGMRHKQHVYDILIVHTAFTCSRNRNAISAVAELVRKQKVANEDTPQKQEGHNNNNIYFYFDDQNVHSVSAL
jgi:hypothetical protein